ncbi:MAG: hypothetical protein NVV72_13450 [Asticcacaulis sp.]|nr:hypothetical protein [Asticcacaulis sp.]
MPKTLQSLLTAAIALLLTGGTAVGQPAADTGNSSQGDVPV